MHVKNSAEIGYNLLRSQEIALAWRWRCEEVLPAPHVVGQEKIITEIYGITSSKPDYVVFVSCETGLRKSD